MQRAWLRLDLQALQHNLGVVKTHAKHAKVMAVVKADAYGHCMLDIADAIKSEVSAFAVATLEEALALRSAILDLPIVCLSGLFSADQLAEFQAHQISPVIYDQLQLSWFDALPAPFKGDVWLKLNTGMNRAGTNPDHCLEDYQQLSSLVSGEVRLMSHFSDADDLDSEASHRQIERFDAATQALTCERSMANSAGVLAWSAAHYDWVRPGIMLYGACPLAGQQAQTFDLKPVMSLEARLIKIQDIEPGEAVGYGSQWQASRATSIGLVACGYGDGYPRHLNQPAHAFVGGQRVPIVGRVSMDSLCIDLHDVPQVTLGDTVQLWGDCLPVDELANWAGTIAYELCCKVTKRPARIVQN